MEVPERLERHFPTGLGRALLLSLLFHAVLLVPSGAPEATRAVPLQAVLAKPVEPVLPDEIRAGPPPRPAKPHARTNEASAPVEEPERDLPYPPEAVARKLEGEVLILLFVDESGNALAARIERGSGHAILDEAAMRAAKAMRFPQGDASREVLLPVRFRLL